jgi:ubiquitin carboxyl-terminal hydrolase 4/11/15
MFTNKDNGNSLAITWSEKSIKTMWSRLGLTSSVKIHPSVEELKEKSSECTLMDCIDLFTKNEQLGPEDPWYCPRCEEQQQAYKKFDLWKLPNILVIQIKRFSSNRYQKLSMNVTFPVDILDISQYVINDQEKKSVYSLYAVSNHFGSMGGGHYTAFCKNDGLKEWFIFDDSNVRPLKGSPVNPAAYVLFYQKIN